nr:reverse transcriptase domain-containing protein [Tanacetum cinerariifolium]
MQTRSSSRLVSNPSSNPTPSTNLNLKGRNRRRSKQRIENFNLEELSPPIVAMADQCTMAQLLQEPTEGYKDAIIVPSINADNFELKHCAARIWLEKEPPRSIFTWDDLVSKFINQFFPLSKTTNLRNEITNFQQRFDESFSEAWDRFKDLLQAYPHHDQDSLNSAAGGNFLDKMPRECLAIIESKSKVSYSRNKPVVAKVSTNTSTSAITTRSGVSYDGPQIQPSTYFLPKVVEDEPEATKDTLNPTNNGSTEDVQPQVVQSKSPIVNSEPVTSLISEPAIALKLPEKLGDPGKFLIPCDFPGMAECLALADLDARINLMSFSVWKSLSLPDLTPMCMTLELADRSISHPVRVVEDVYVKVGSFHFSADFVVVDFDADPRVPLILGRSFLKTKKYRIDVFEGELTIRVGKEAITFNLDQTSRYSANYSDMTAKRIDVIDMACEEYSQEVLGFSDTISSGNPTPFYDPIVSTTSPTLTPFGNSDFLLEEVDAFLAIEDDPTSSEFYQPYLDPEGDILLLKAFLNDDPLPPSS